MGCISATLAGLAQDCSRSMGGIQKVIIAPYSANTFDLAGETGGKIHCYSLTADTKDWRAYYFRKGNGQATSTLNVDPANGVNFVSTELALTFTRQDTEKRVEMSALAQMDLVCCYKDYAGQWWALGIDSPVTCTAGTAATGAQKTDGNNYQITLTAEDKTWPIELNLYSSQGADSIGYPSESTSQYTNAGEWPGGSPINDNPATQPIGG